MKFILSVVFLASTLSGFAVGPSPYTEGLIVSIRTTLTYTGGSLGGSGSVSIFGEGNSGGSSAYVNTGEGTPGIVWLKPGKKYTTGNWLFGAGGAPGMSTNINFASDVSFVAPAGYTLYLNDVPVDVAHPTFHADSNSAGSVSSSQPFTVELRPNIDSQSLPAGTFTGIRIGKAISWEIGLGSLRAGQSAGRLVFREPDFSNNPGSRDRLDYVAPSNTGQISVTPIAGPGPLQQVATPQAIVDLVDEGNGYRIKFSDQTPSHTTWRSILVQYVSPDLTITEYEGSATRVTKLSLAVVSGNNVWTIQEGDGTTVLRTTTHTNSVPASGQRDDTVLVRTGGPSGSIVQKTKYHYEVQNAIGGWGEELTEITADPDAANLKTTYSYHTTSSAYGNYLRVKSIIDPTGGWVSYSYYDDWDKRGQLAVETRPYVDTPGTVSAAALSVGNSTSHSYVADYSGRYRIDSSDTTNITTVQSGGSSTSPTLFQSRNNRQYTSYQTTAAASGSLSQSSVVETIDSNQAGDFAGSPYAVKRPDSSQDSYAYYYGSYSGTTFSAFTDPPTSPVDNSTYFRTIVWHGSTDSAGATAFTAYDAEAVSMIYLIPNASTMDVTIRNPAGLVVRSETWVYTGGASFSLLNYADLSYDVAGRLTQRLAGNNAKAEYSYSNGRLDYTIDETGTKTNFNYDALGRVSTMTKAGVAVTGATQGDIVTAFTYDGAGNITQTVVSGGTGGSLQTITSTAQYDLAGRPTQQVQFVGSANSLTTGYVYSSGGRIVQTTLPGGATKTTETYLDGQLKQVGGSGVVAENYSYSIYGAGLRLAQSYPGGNSSMLTKVFSDWLGRPVEKEIPGWNGTLDDKFWYYNSAGLLTKQTDPATAPTLYEYDTLGRQTVQGLDINLNGVLDRGSDDRIFQQNQGIYSWDSGASWWLRTQNYTFASSGVPTGTCVGTKISRLNPSTDILDQSVTYDANSNPTTETVSVDRAAKLVTTTTDTPDSSTNAIQSVYNGQLIDTTDATGVQMKYGYDVLGRQVQSIDPRTGSTDTTYMAGSNFVAWVKDPANAFQSTNQFDGAGRLSVVAVPNPHYGVGGDTRSDLATRYSYNDRNQLVHRWGEMVAPVEYAYDSLGRQTQMTTYAASTASFTGNNWPVSPGAPQTTTWNYDAATGFLSSKADAAGKSVLYTYTQAGQVYQRTWARGVVTTYTYSGTTGELTGTTYSDGTPSVGYQYNRLGKPSTVTDFTGTRTFNYNLAGTLELQSETLGSWFYGDHKISRGYATSGVVGRYNNLSVGTAANSSLYYSIDYGYDGNGRPGSIRGVTYAYTPKSHLISTITDTWTSYPQTQTRSYLLVNDALDKIETKWSSTSVAKFVYGHDSMYRVNSVGCTGEADVFGRYGNGIEGLTRTYDYNDRSEIISDVTKVGVSSTVLTGRNDSYDFDLLGNRKTATHNSNVATYTLQTNNLNQYDHRTVPGVFDVAGGSTAGTVTVNGSAATSQGQYYFEGYGVTNTTLPFFNTLTVVAGATTTYLPAFVAGTPENFTYDDDGNLATDGQWHYYYDAENRVSSIQTGGAAVAMGYPNIAFNFSYDYLGRRVLKYNYQWSGSTWVYTGVQKRYLYDGWNLLFELDGNGNNLKNYAWGLDLSGTLQGAGGVGGLLGSYDCVTGLSLDAVYDGNGNVVAMLDRTDGSVAAAYEYDAFGKTVRESGPHAEDNSFRYSTKYTDLETGLVYYGQRYYSPSMGRFINKDPIEEAGGLNLYAFCGNNGVNKWDYLGEDDKWATVWNWNGKIDSSWKSGFQYGIDGGYADGYLDFATKTFYSREGGYRDTSDTSEDPSDYGFGGGRFLGGPVEGQTYAEYRAANFGWVDGLVQYGDQANNWADSIGPVNVFSDVAHSLGVGSSGSNSTGSISYGQSTGFDDPNSLLKSKAPNNTDVSLPNFSNPARGSDGSNVYYNNGKFNVSDSLNMANHVETDGKGGLKVVVRETFPWILANPAIMSGIYLHEGTHIEDALASDPKIGEGFFEGLTVGASTPDVGRMTELNATTVQLRYLNNVLGLPAGQTFLTPDQMDQVRWHIVFVQNYQNKFLGLPPQPLPPISPSW